MLEDELKSVKSSLYAELERNRQLHEDLGRVKNDLEKSLKWTWSSDAITVLYKNNGGKRQVIKFQREKTPYNSYSKYVTVPDNWLCTHCGNTGTLRKHEVSPLETAKKGYILGIGRIGKSLSHSIENVYYVNGLKYSLLSVSQIYDKGNKSGDLNCLSVVDDDAELWHRRPGHASFTLLNKLVKKDLDSHDKIDQEGEQSIVPGEVIDNGTAESPDDIKEPGSSITTTEAENRVADADQGTPHAERESHSEIPGPSHNKVRVSNWKHKSSHPLKNVITPLDLGIQTRSKARNALAFSFFLSQIEPKNIKEALKMLIGLQPCKKKSINLRGTVYGTWFHDLLTELNKARLVVQGYNQEEGIDYDGTFAPVSRMEAIRILIAFASHMEFKLFQMDVKSAFLNGFLKEQESHLKTAKRILRYLKGTQDLVLYYPSRDKFDLIGYANADYVGYLVDRKSTSGMAYFLGSCLISWGIRKQNSVALSTAEAEYVAAASCCAQLLWIKQQLKDFHVLSDCVPLLCDNTSALNMAKNPVQHKRTKHIDVRHHFLRDNVEKGLICIKFCSTEDQIADIFTKALSREHFEKNRMALGLIKSS
ncbi:uncharacterized protein [Nicotiana tomentosiformis]|uniref:uncharacterized protein n=1 Tax=Nicotiana tomentosiformis TaxID=4098 RepID=UPI00388CB670